MSKKHVLILWILAALLGASVAAVRISQNKGAEAVTKLSRGDLLFGHIPAAEITTIKVEDHEQSTTLTKTDGGWVVGERGDFPANIPVLAALLDNLNGVKIGQGLEAGPTYNARFGMDGTATDPDEHGLLLTLTAPGKDPWTVALGKTTAGEQSMMNPMAPPSGGGRYVRISDDPESVYVIEETFPRVTADPKDWLSEEFLQVSKLKSISLRAPNDSAFEPWSLARDSATGEFTLEGLGEQETLIDTVVSPLKNLFSFARFEDVLSEEVAKELRDDSLARQAVLTTFDGLTYTVEIAPKKAEEGAEPEPASNPNHLLRFTVTADLPEQRSPADDESEEDKTKKDAAFAKEQKELREKLAKVQKLQGRVFEITKWTVDPLLKSRADMVAPEEQPAPTYQPPPAPGLEDAFGFPKQ